MSNGSNPGNEKVENDPRVWSDTQEYHADTDHQGNDINNVGATSVERLFIGRVASTPADADIPSGHTVLYYKNGEPETLYQKPDGGNESTVGGNTGGATQLDSGSLGTFASDGTEPNTQTFTIDAVVTDQTATVSTVDVYVDPSPAWNETYSYHIDWSENWEDANGHMDIDVDVTWDDAPSNGNDLSLSYIVWDAASGGGGSTGFSTLASGTETLDNTTNPAFDADLGLSLNEGVEADLTENVDTATTPAEDYAYSVNFWKTWDDSAGAMDIHLQVDWQTQPSSSFDIEYKVVNRA